LVALRSQQKHRQAPVHRIIFNQQNIFSSHFSPRWPVIVLAAYGRQQSCSAETKSEIRISKSETNRSQMNSKFGKFKTPIPDPPVWNIEAICRLIVLNLFRISDFVLRVSCSWRLYAPSTVLRTCFAGEYS